MEESFILRMGVETTGWLQRGQDNTCRTMSASGSEDPLGVGVPRFVSFLGLHRCLMWAFMALSCVRLWLLVSKIWALRRFSS